MICYHQLGINFSPKFKTKIYRWVKTVTQNLGFERITVNYIFCSDAELLEINRKFLNHDYYTDIITFDTLDDQRIKSHSLSGDIFISIDSIRINALQYDVSFDEELHRVMIHGILHLAGFHDYTDEEISEMRNQENIALALWYAE